MGNNNVKKPKKHTQLTRYEARRIADALHDCFKTDVTRNINAEVIQEFWKQELVPSLLQQYKNYLCPTENSKCSIDEFGDLYVTLVRGSCDEKAYVIAKIVGCGPDEMNIPYSKLLNYVADLLESYIIGIGRRRTHEYLSWDGRISNVTSPVFVKVAENWCRQLIQSYSEVTDEEGMTSDCQVSEDVFVTWLINCGVLTTLHQEKMKMLYGVEEEEDYDEDFDVEDDKSSMLPLLKNPEALGTTQSVLLPSYLLHLNFLLPQDYQREWRFLYSTTKHGESFSMLLSRILDKGPTLIIVADDENHLFGGFASCDWLLSPKFQGDTSCFLFTLKPDVNVFCASGYNANYMYLNNHQQSMPNGLGMGGQFNYWGLWLDADFGRGMCSDVCTTYKNYKMMSSVKEFKIKHVEVWGVGSPPLTLKEKGERIGILDKDPTASSLMEMAGKTQHSTGLRNPTVS